MVTDHTPREVTVSRQKTQNYLPELTGYTRLWRPSRARPHDPPKSCQKRRTPISRASRESFGVLERIRRHAAAVVAGDWPAPRPLTGVTDHQMARSDRPRDGARTAAPSGATTEFNAKNRKYD